MLGGNDKFNILFMRINEFPAKKDFEAGFFGYLPD